MKNQGKRLPLQHGSSGAVRWVLLALLAAAAAALLLLPPELRADETHVVSQQIPNESGEAGIWMISAPRAVEGRHFFDVHIQFSEELDGYATFGAGRMLRAEQTTDTLNTGAN